MKTIKLVGLFLAFGLMLTSAVNAQTSKFAALAIDKANGFYYGWANDHPSLAEAEKRAMAECTKSGGKCSVVLSFSGTGCGVYRTVKGDVGTAYGWGIAATQTEADKIATAEALKRSNGKSAENFVFGCNSKTKETLKIIQNEAQTLVASTECLVQFEATLDKDGNSEDFMGELRSPVYHLTASDCPYAKDSAYHAYAFFGPDGFPQRESIYREQKERDSGGKGQQLSEGFYNWLQTKKSPSGTIFRTVGSTKVSTVTPYNIKELTENVGKTEYIDESLNESRTPTCISYLPENIKPLKVYGESQCQSWIK